MSPSASRQQRQEYRDLIDVLRDSPHPEANGFAPFLADRDFWVRDAAIDALISLGSVDSARLIGPHLDDPESTVRMNAAEAMGKLRYEPAIPRLISRMKRDRTPIVRVCAAEAIGDIGTSKDEFLEALSTAMETDSNELVRAYAADSLGRLGAARMQLRIRGQFERDRSARARASMLQALYRLGDDTALQRLLTMLRRVRRWEMEAAILNLLREIATPKNRGERRLAVREIAEVKPMLHQFHGSDADLFEEEVCE